MTTKQEQIDFVKSNIKDLDERIAQWEATSVRYLENGTGDIERARNYLKDANFEHSRLAQKLRMLEAEPADKEFKDYL